MDQFGLGTLINTD